MIMSSKRGVVFVTGKGGRML